MHSSSPRIRAADITGARDACCCAITYLGPDPCAKQSSGGQAGGFFPVECNFGWEMHGERT